MWARTSGSIRAAFSTIHVEREFAGFEACGQPEHGYAWLLCRPRGGSIALVLDGTFVPTRRGGVSFRRATPTTTDIEALVADIADRCEAWLATQGYGAEDDVAPEDDDTVGLIQAASIHGRPLTSRRARRVKRTQVLGGREHALAARTASCDGYNLNAGTYVPAKDRGGLERLARYVLRRAPRDRAAVALPRGDDRRA